MTAYAIYFSPTRTSERIARAIARGTGADEVIDVDLTHDARRVTLPASALAVIAIPVYGGHLPPLATERLRGLQGSGTPAVTVVVYGNRAYENALTELAALAGAAGLNVVAAATFVGEHSYSSDRWPIAAGRPDADDLALAAEFGGRVAGKLQDTARGGRTDTIDVSRISRPRQPLLPLIRFIAGVIRLRRGGKPLPRTPQPSDRHSCTHCGLCVTLCPSGAIARGDETRTDATKCIRCCACVKSCPSHARIYDTPFASLLSKCFKRRKAPRTIL